MPLHAGSDLGLATTWRAHRANQHGVNECAERMLVVLEIVPAALVEHLAKNLDGRLRSVLLNLRHVQIIDEDDDFLAVASTEHAGSPLVKFAINYVLNLVAMGLGRETNLDGDVLGSFQSLVQLVHEHVLDVGRLACAGRANEQCWNLVDDAELLDVTVSLRVHRRYDDVLHLGIFAEVVDVFLVNIVHPVLPLVLLFVVNVVVDLTLVEDAWEQFLVSLELGEVLDATVADLLQVAVNHSAIVSVNGDAERPDAREEEHVVNVGNCHALVQVIRPFFVLELLQEGTPEATKGLDQSLVIRTCRLNAVFADKFDNGFNDDVDKLTDVFHVNVVATFLVAFLCSLCLEEGWQRVLPGLVHGSPTELSWLHVDHTAARDRGGGRYLQVHWLEDHVHVVCHLDDLSTH